MSDIYIDPDHHNVTVDAERAVAARAMLRNLRRDIVQDVHELDGQPFEGKVVAEAIGNLAAQVDALANVCLFLLGDES